MYDTFVYKKISDDELKERIDYWIKLSKFFKKEAFQYGIPFYETDEDRKIKLNDLCKKIVNDISEKERE